MQNPPRLGWSDLTILYTSVFKLSSSNAGSELRKAEDLPITSNLWIEM